MVNYSIICIVANCLMVYLLLYMHRLQLCLMVYLLLYMHRLQLPYYGELLYASLQQLAMILSMHRCNCHLVLSMHRWYGEQLYASLRCHLPFGTLYASLQLPFAIWYSLCIVATAIWYSLCIVAMVNYSMHRCTAIWYSLCIVAMVNYSMHRCTAIWYSLCIVALPFGTLYASLQLPLHLELYSIIALP
jgi:hypothetical protein